MAVKDYSSEEGIKIMSDDDFPKKLYQGRGGGDICLSVSVFLFCVAWFMLIAGVFVARIQHCDNVASCILIVCPESSLGWNSVKSTNDLWFSLSSCFVTLG